MSKAPESFHADHISDGVAAMPCGLCGAAVMSEPHYVAALERALAYMESYDRSPASAVRAATINQIRTALGRE